VPLLGHPNNKTQKKNVGGGKSNPWHSRTLAGQPRKERGEDALGVAGIQQDTWEKNSLACTRMGKVGVPGA